MIEPILLYGSEVWGYEDLYLIEQVHLKFCKRILRVRNTTPNFMVYGELGRFPLELRVKLRIVSFWIKLLQCEGKLSNILYRLMFFLQENGVYNFRWIQFIKQIFNDIGMSEVYTNQFSYVSIKHAQITLQDQFIQKWFSDIQLASRGEFYSLVKNSFGIEQYLLKLSDSHRVWITKMRTSNLHLPIETGRWSGISRHERICKLCNQTVGDEFHILFCCTNDKIVKIRGKYLPKYYYINPNTKKMEGLLSFCNIPVLRSLSVFIRNVSTLL